MHVRVMMRIRMSITNCQTKKTNGEMCLTESDGVWRERG